MFQARFSFTFSRLFRFRRRRAAKPNTSPADVVRASFSAPPRPSKLRRPVSLQLATINAHTASAQRPRSTFISSLLSPIAQSPPPSPNVTSHAGTPPPIIIIGRAESHSTLPLPPAPAPPADVGPQIPVDGVLLVEPPPASNARRVSFQLPATDTQDRPDTPLSTCSTLVTEVGAQAEAEAAPAVPPEQPPAFETPDSGSVGAVPADADPVDVLPNVGRSRSGRARPTSLFSPRPLQVNMSRFSLPVRPSAQSMATGTNTTDSRRESRRTSFMTSVSRSSSTKKEKRTTRWSRELNKPETQEVLRVLRGL